jgi:hypothetical protein
MSQYKEMSVLHEMNLIRSNQAATYLPIYLNLWGTVLEKLIVTQLFKLS